MGTDLCVSGEESCSACMALTPEQKLQLSILSCKQRKDKKKGKSDKVNKTDKLVDLSSVSVTGPASSADDHVESMDNSEPSHSLSECITSTDLQAPVQVNSLRNLIVSWKQLICYHLNTSSWEMAISI